MYTFAERLYVIHDKPIDKLPIRRLQQEGADVLAVNDLLHIALGKVDGFEHLLSDYGSKFLTTLTTVEEVVEALKIDTVQATRLLAILALGKRLYGVSGDQLPIIHGIEDIYSHYRFMSALPKEQMRIALINSRYQLVHDEVIAMGGANWLQLSPVEIFQSAIARSISAVILVHNHPTGSPIPSTEDIEFTARIQELAQILGVTLLDHVIIGKEGYQSCLVT